MEKWGTPLGARVVVEPVVVEKSAGGVYMPGQYQPDEGIVRAVGEGRLLDNGALVPVRVKVGDHVSYSKYSGSPINRNGYEYLVIAEKDLLEIAPPEAEASKPDEQPAQEHVADGAPEGSDAPTEAAEVVPEPTPEAVA